MHILLKIVLAVGLVGMILATALFWMQGGDRNVDVLDVEDRGGDERRDDAPVIDPEVYRQAVSFFFTGVAALDADANPRAQAELTRASEVVPEEPAVWLNLGLAEIRLGNNDAAEQALAQARRLAPEWGVPDTLSGHLESRRGRTGEAIELFRSAVTKDPDDIRTLYALAEELERVRQDSAQTEIQRLFAEILDRVPANVAVLIEQARLAVKIDDAQTLRDVVSRLEGLTEAWPPLAQEFFDQLRTASDEADMQQAASRVMFLRNVLVAEPVFQAALAEVRVPVGVVGVPAEQFQVLPNPAPTPSPADAEVSFSVERLIDGDAGFATLVAVPSVESQTSEPSQDGQAGATESIDILVTDGREIRSTRSDDATLEFPGGPQSSLPGSAGLLAVDWNSDFAIDLVAAGAGGVRLFRREADGGFVDVTRQTGLDPAVHDRPAIGVWAVDIELDGDLDLLIGWQQQGVSVLQNGGDGTFTEIHSFEDLTAEGTPPVRLATWSDLDRDGLPDVALLDEQGGLHVLLNKRSGRYTRASLPENDGPFAAMTTGDINADGRIDLVLLRQDGVLLRVSYEREGDRWQSAEMARHDDLPDGPLRLLLADLDNNGGIDVVVAGASQSHAWLADQSGEFLALPERVETGALAVVDLNTDGRVDLIGMSQSGTPVRAVNQGTRPYHWQVLRPRATQTLGDGRINSFGLGGEVELRSGLIVQRQVVTGPSVHFGLGESPRSDVFRIVWPNGTVQAEFDVQADQVVRAEQRLKGSCPFVFAHDGTTVRFVTDFLWRSPLGLRINAQDTAGVSQTEDWIKIGADQLSPHDGYYDVRITAELWETHYFDRVALMVVDHPADEDVFVDERFARTPPQLILHPTGRLHPVHARDHHGNDVSDVVRSADGNYLDALERGRYQGVAREHWVEVEIPEEVPRGEGMRLIARGWVHPTDSSINVALSQGRHEPPQDLSLDMPSADGEWETAQTGLGFPAGKDKTIVVELDGLFAPDQPRRFRLRTNLEVFWDRLAVAFAADRDRLQTQILSPETAVLRHRGYSLMTQADASSPELPHYHQLMGAAQRWNDLEGYYTRFGDVKELLLKTDDRYVIANAGDELALRFPVPSGPPPGWTRDFVLVGDGWNKDGDYNTAFSGTVRPLPSHASPAYDQPPGELADDPVYRQHAEDWQVYHTRYVTPADFQRGLRSHTAGR